MYALTIVCIVSLNVILFVDTVYREIFIPVVYLSLLPPPSVDKLNEDWAKFSFLFPVSFLN